jgi:hypothetical protein
MVRAGYKLIESEGPVPNKVWEIMHESKFAEPSDEVRKIKCDEDTATWLQVQLNRLHNYEESRRHGGTVKTPAKAAASRANGLKGGRPPRVAT